MAPRYPRASNIAQPNALVTVDAIFAIIWLSAFATQAAYNTANDCGTACGASKGIVALGVFETYVETKQFTCYMQNIPTTKKKKKRLTNFIYNRLFWGLSTFISWATLQYFNTNGVLPGYDAIHNKHARTHTVDDYDPDKAAFSTGPADEEAYAPLGGGGLGHDSDEPEFNAAPYGGRMSPSYGGGHEPGLNTGYGGAGAHSDTSYGGGAQELGSVGSRYDMNTAYASQAYESHGPAPGTEMGGPHAHLYSPPPAEHDEYGQPVTFPAGNYDNIGLRQV